MLTPLLVALAGTVIAVVVGTFWYMPSTPMGKIHMKAIGFDKLSPEEQKRKMEEAKPKMARMYALQMTFSFLTAFAVSFIVIQSMRNGLTLSMALGFVVVNWLCFIVPTVGSGAIWSSTCEDMGLLWKKFFSDIFSVLLTLILTALLAGVVA